MATEDARKLFVAGLPESITEEVLRQLFEATGGKVVEVSLPKDRATGKARGFGFVTFAVAEEASNARDALDGSMQAGRAISVRPFSSEPPRRGEQRSDMRSEAPAPAAPAEDRTLYVGNLPYDTTQQEVVQLLEQNGVGPVVRMHLPTGPDGRLRGFGFVTLATADAANLAINALRNADVRGRRLMINIAHPRGAPGATGGMTDRPRPRTDMPGPGGPRFPTEPPMGIENRPPGPRRVGGPPETDWAEEAKKKKKKGAKGAASRSSEERRRGGGSNWTALDDRDDDDK